jgi:NAD(P)-dependent dehydrogenase (short-subunit alcohol dehydrogenase family)
MTFTSSILITGGTSGLGYQCAIAIAGRYPQYRIVIASRNGGQSIAESINNALGQNNTIYLPLNLASLTQVRSFAQTWQTQKLPPIRALLLNAGLQFPKGLHFTVDGIEATFGINHVGHALLFHLLLQHLEDGARIVITSSGTHDPAQHSGLPDASYTSGADLAYPLPESAGIDGRQRYSTSKLVNVLWMHALKNRLMSFPERRLSVVAFDPGLMPGTNLAREYSSFLRWLWTSIMPHMIPLMRRLVHPNIHTAKESGESLAWLALDDESGASTGVYYEGRKEIKSSDESYDKRKQEELWKWTLETIASGDEELRKFDTLT